MVEEVRGGQSLRQVAAAFGVSVSTVAHWVEHAQGIRIDRVSFASRKPGHAWNRTNAIIEQRILRTRRALREKSVLGEYGADAIGVALQERAVARSPALAAQAPARATIYRVLERHGALDATHRQRRPAPPKGRSTLPINIFASMPCADVIRPHNRSFAKSTFLALLNSSKDCHECSVNAETLSHRRQKSVRLTLRLALLPAESQR